MILPPVDTIEIPTSDDFPVRGDLYVPTPPRAVGQSQRASDPSLTRSGSQTPARRAHGLVVLAHGFKGYKTWGFLPYLATRLCEAGLAVMSIDFSFNGTFPEPPAGDPVRDASRGRRPVTRYPRPDLFRDNTVTREFEDLRSVVRFLEDNRLAAFVDSPLSLGLFGHSRGGVAAILNAVENDGIKALCTWSAPDHADSFTHMQKEKWRRHGEYAFTDARDGTELSMAVRYLDDLEENRDKYDLRKRVVDLYVPHLIVHGEMDLVVPKASAYILLTAERDLDDKQLLMLRTGHTFGVDDSLDGPPPQPLVEATNATVDWFQTRLKKGA